MPREYPVPPTPAPPPVRQVLDVLTGTAAGQQAAVQEGLLGTLQEVLRPNRPAAACQDVCWALTRLTFHPPNRRLIVEQGRPLAPFPATNHSHPPPLIPRPMLKVCQVLGGGGARPPPPPPRL